MMPRIFKRINELFLFSNSERKGIFILLCLIFFLFILWMGIPYILKPEKPDFSQYRAQIEKLKKKNGNPEGEIQSISLASDLFAFDPNKVDSLQLVELGFTEKQIRNILHYRQKEGVFRKKEDLKKIYGISESSYRRLEPWIILGNTEFSSGNFQRRDLPEKSKTEGEERIYEKRKNLTLIELNNADSILLTSLPGIGPVFAQRILKYRNLLGGYHHKEQLMEVYGLSSELFGQIAQRIEVDSSKISPIHLNGELLGLDKRKRHPYLDIYSLRSLETYKRSRSRINSINELIENQVLSPEVYNRIRPYLTID